MNRRVLAILVLPCLTSCGPVYLAPLAADTPLNDGRGAIIGRVMVFKDGMPVEFEARRGAPFMTVELQPYVDDRSIMAIGDSRSLLASNTLTAENFFAKVLPAGKYYISDFDFPASFAPLWASSLGFSTFNWQDSPSVFMFEVEAGKSLYIGTWKLLLLSNPARPGEYNRIELQFIDESDAARSWHSTRFPQMPQAATNLAAQTPVRKCGALADRRYCVDGVPLSR